MCRPPEKRSSAVTSALRSEVLRALHAGELVLDHRGHRHVRRPLPPRHRLASGPATAAAGVLRVPGTVPPCTSVAVTARRPRRPGRRPAAPDRAVACRRARPPEPGPARRRTRAPQTGDHGGQQPSQHRRSRCATPLRPDGPAGRCRCSSGENPSVSPGCGSRLSTTTTLAWAAASAARSCGHEQVRQHGGVPGARARARRRRPRRWRRAPPGGTGGSGGETRISRTRPGVDAIATWPRMVRVRSGSSGSTLSTRATRSSGTSAIGSTRPRAPSSSPRSSSAAHRVAAVELGQAGEHEVADRVTGEHSRAAEPVLEQAGHRLGALALAGQRGQGHPQVAGRQHGHLAADAARGAAVVGDRDHGGHVRRDPPPGRQRRRQTVPAAERDHPAAAALPAHYSRPRSRWRATAAMPSADSRRANSSAIATLRCLPPVQPDREGQVALALAPVAGHEQPQHVGVAVEELLGVVLAEHVVAHVRGPARCAGAAPAPSAGWAGTGRRRRGRRPAAGRT